MKSAKTQPKNTRYIRRKYQVFQRNFLFRTGMSRTTLISLILLLSACHTRFSQNDMLPCNSSRTIEQTSKDNIYVTLNAMQHLHILQIYGGAYHDAKLERLLANIVHKLRAVSPNSHQSYSVTILNSESVNAFALPNGSIYITRGMLALANDCAEVASVLAHEIAHITAHHGILRRQKEAELKMKNPMSSNLLSHTGRKIQNPIEDKQQLAQFSRNQELEADSLALDMLQQAGYDPFASPRFLQSMEAYSVFRNISGIPNAPLDFLASHPTTPQRVRLAIEKAGKISPSNIGITERDSFLKSIDGMIFRGNFQTGFVRGNQFIHPQLRVTFSVPTNFTIENSMHTLWASGPGNIAIRFDSVPHPAGMSASDYLKSGWLVGLDKLSVRPITLHGLPGAHARAANEQWQFDVVVILFNKHVFRFLTAAPHNSKNFEEIAKNTVQSFDFLSSSQLKKLKPLRIRIVRVKKGESIAQVANKMHYTTHKEKLFRVLNALSPSQTLHTDTNVKVITE
ncbi:putative Zn-dependent protease [Bartonella callosciuri]|uniref:Putative Zn-dependent protease n=1 Tax=Bartonella callosciuri TaxID=686223 RepID=A0A840NT13_9HYPH|nr:M48 family metalloprotease [Bartonella callosciuri]MBB5074201.1 putative Zn-dependent protease [Bartonella callosciuri]